jgi:hypothetical protein
VTHVQTTPEALTKAQVTFCINDACSNATFQKPDDAGLVPPTATTGIVHGQLTGPISGTLDMAPDEAGWTILDVGPEIYPLENTHDGDRYGIRVVGADGVALIDFTRGVRYTTTVQPNGPSCEPTCKTGEVNVWPTSASGLTCDANGYESGATLTIATDFGAAGSADILRACRNDTCLEIALSQSATSKIKNDQARPLRFFYGLSTGTLTMHIDGEPATLKDGDRYRLSMLSAKGDVLGEIDEVATYAVSFPNGAECDPYPTKRFVYPPK